MRQLTCELCGGTDLVKQDGVFVCQTCGCKYSVEEARKMMMGDGAAPAAPAAPAAAPAPAPAAPAQPDHSVVIDSYLMMAKNALEASNYAEAESYANKIIELEPRHSRAWMIKGKAAGWQTTGRNNRYPEAIVNWGNAYQFAEEGEERAALKDEITEEARDITLAYMNMECKSFVNYRSQDNANDISKALSIIQKQVVELLSKTTVWLLTDDFMTSQARVLNTCAVNASNETDKEFGTERRHQGKFEWNKYTQSQDRCLSLLKAAYGLSKDDDLSFTIAKNFIVIGEAVRDSCSYKFQASAYSDGTYVQEYTFTADAKKSRTKDIDEFKKRRDFHDPDKRKQDWYAVVQNCENELGPMEEGAAHRKYWEEHADEKAALEAEKAELDGKIGAIRKGNENDPLLKDKIALESAIMSMTAELGSLGMFKGKEKKAIQDKMATVRADLNGIETKLAAARQQREAEAAPLQTRINEIDAELTKSRGRIPFQHGEVPALFDAENKKMIVTPLQLMEYVKNRLPQPYHLKTGTEEDLVNLDKNVFEAKQHLNNIRALLGDGTERHEEWQDDPNKNKTYRINIFKGDEQTAGGLECRAKAASSVIDGIFYFNLGDGFTPEKATDFVKVVSVLLFDLLPSTDFDGLEKLIAAGVYNVENTRKIQTDEGFVLKFKRDGSVTLNLFASDDTIL